MSDRKVKIYTLFLSSGRPVGYEAYRRYHPDVKIMNNGEILDEIKREAEGVEFIGTPEPVKAEDAIPKIKEREDIDGLLVFGPPPDGLISIGLPMVAVERPLEGCTTVPFHSYRGSKVVTSFLPAHRDKNPEVYSSRIRDIVRKIELISAVARMKGLRILVVTDLPPLGYFEPIGLQIEKGREEYEETYTRNLKETLGAELVPVPQRELIEKMKAADEGEAKEIAEGWIKGAIALRGTNEEEVVKSAKLYIAMRELMREHDCGAITTEGYGWPPLGYGAGIPSQGLPSTQFCTDGVVATSETLTDCLITQQLGLHITGSAGFMGDYTIDPVIDVAIIAHCEGSLRPYGDERKAPYIIRNLPFVPENTGGACAQINYPIGEKVTVAKISIYKKRLSLFTGESVSGEELFPYWDDVLGRIKVAIKTDGRKLIENVDWRSFGNHRVVFFGDYKRDFEDMARLIGFEVVESA